MHVAVGSLNPVKYRATERALGERATSVVRVDVDSGVSEQPTSSDETIRGATNRARRARAAGDHDLGVGIEGGVARVERVDGLFLTMWAAVADTEISVGAGPRLRLPDSIATALEDGAELGPLLDERLGTEEIKTGQGAVGVFTTGIVDREAALRQAVAAALAPVLSTHYDRSA